MQPADLATFAVLTAAMLLIMLKFVPVAPDIMLQVIFSVLCFQGNNAWSNVHGFLKRNSLLATMRHNMQADRARTDALTNGDDIFRVSTKGGNIVTNPYICLQG